ncbi:hypothetical protein B7463_g1853, partial [Scytalidium lignicola]
MSTTLPVPSKGALRILRNLALGTSCTVAFGAAVLTEDRRRRIRALREVHSNAEKLKSSRNYHSQGATIVESLEENALKGLGLIHTKSQSPAKSPPPLPLSAYDVPSSDYWVGVPEATEDVYRGPNNKGCSNGCSPASNDLEDIEVFGRGFESGFPGKSIKPHGIEVPRGLYDGSQLFAEWERLQQSTAATLTYETAARLETENDIRQGRLVLDIVALLDNAATLNGVGKHHALDAAATRFAETFEDGMDIQHIREPLLGAIIRLSRACISANQLQAALKILETFVSSPIDAKVYYQLSPAPIIQYLLRDPVFKADKKDLAAKMQLKLNLQRAIRLFLVKFNSNQSSLPPPMSALGEALCEASCNHGLYHLTDKIYHRLVVGQKEEVIKVSKYLIIAAHERGDHTSTIGYFQKYYSKISQDKAGFSSIFNRVASSVLKLGDISKLEEFLRASQIATSCGTYKTPTTGLLQLLGYHWRSGHDLDRTRALFDSLESFVHQSERPEAAYAAIIQFCVEAGDEAKALEYYHKFLSLFPDALPNARISGHLALAKAMRGDWTAVRTDFEKMSKYSTNTADSNICSEVFVPVLKLFAATHQIRDTEQFLQSFIRHCNIQLNLYMSNIMVDAYAQVGEIDSLAKWIQYAASVGCPFDSVSFNIVLNKCHSRWKFTFDDLNRLFKYIRENLSGYTEGLISADTISIMRRIAVAEYDGNAPAIATIMTQLGLQPKSIQHLDCQRLQEDMAKALAMDEPEKALELYTEAFMYREVQVNPEILAAAVKASLQLNGTNISQAMDILEQAKRCGCKDMTSGIVSIFMHELSRLHAKDLVESTSRFIFQNIRQRGIPVPINVVTHTVNILVKTHRYEEALTFWNSMSSSLGGHSSINLPTLTVLLNAHIGLGNSQGIKWIMETLVTSNMIPDKQLVQNLKNARRATAKKIRTAKIYREDPGYDLLRFQAVLEEALQQVMAIRAAARVEKIDVKQKVINIIEKAIEDQRVAPKAIHRKGSERVLHAEYSVLNTLHIV